MLVILCAPLLYYRLTQERRRAVIERISLRDIKSNARSSRIRAAAYNIAHGRHGIFIRDNMVPTRASMLRQLRAIGSGMRALKVDLLVLNEVDFNVSKTFGIGQAEIIAREAGLSYLARQANVDTGIALKRWYLGNAVLSRFPIIDAQAIAMPKRSPVIDLLAGNLDALRVRVQVKDDFIISVVAVHLEVQSEHARVVSARRLIEVARGLREPLLILGDFNSTPGDFPHSVRNPENDNAMDLLAASGLFHRRPLKGDFTFPARAPERVIDWILANKRLEFRSHRVPRWGHSDHLPVVADVRAY